MLPLLSLGAVFAAPMFAGPLVLAAHPAFDPTTPDALDRAITAAAGAPARDLVVASADVALLAVKPYHGFVPWNVHYAHPRARVPERVQLLQQAAACPDAACFDRFLATSPFGRINAFVLRQDGGGPLLLGTQLPGFPRPQDVTIGFDRGLFDPAHWIATTAAGYAVFVARG
jgi:hypothetical protein